MKIIKEKHHVRNHLETEIRKANRELQQLIKKAAKQQKKNQSQVSSSSSVSGGGSVASEEKMEIRKYGGEDEDEDDDRPCLKHTGLFGFNRITYEFCWSCCLNPNKDAHGCIDDQSVGVLSALAVKPSNFYKPNSTPGSVFSTHSLTHSLYSLLSYIQIYVQTYLKTNRL